jgi:hypothetical protein
MYSSFEVLTSETGMLGVHSTLRHDAFRLDPWSGADLRPAT